MRINARRLPEYEWRRGKAGGVEQSPAVARVPAGCEGYRLIRYRVIKCRSSVAAARRSSSSIIEERSDHAADESIGWIAIT